MSSNRNETGPGGPTDTDRAPVRIVRCHCGGVELELTLPDGIVGARRCNCSICRRRGAIAASVPLAGLNVSKGRELMTLYRFNTMTAEHYFCSRCGTYTHHRRRSDPGEYGFNVACLENFDVAALGEVPETDGVNHVCDRR